MSIENPRTNTNVNVNNRGDHVPSEQRETPHWPGPESDVEFPRQRGDLGQSSSSETFVLPPEETERKPESEPTDEKKGFLNKTWGRVAMAATGVAAGVGVFLAGTQHGESDRPAQVPPVATAESQPSSTASSTAPSSTELTSSPAATAPAAESWTTYNPDIYVQRRDKSNFIIEEKIVTPEQAKQELFTITAEEAPNPEAALAKYADALQKGMNLNSRAETVNARGRAPAVKAENEEIIESGIMSGLGKNHDKVSKAATDDHVLPGTAVWETNSKNVELGTETRAKFENITITTNAPGNYTVRGNLLATGYIQDNAKYTNSYSVQIGMKLENGKWNFSNDTYFMRDN